MKKKVLYIHGFLSGSNSTTIISLQKHYGYKYDFIVPELDADASVSIPKLNEIIKNETPSLIIGNSLGGFYALMCDSGDIPIIVINPCVNPYEHLKRYLNKKLEYHNKRKDGATTYLLTQETLETFKEYSYIKNKIEANVGKIYALLSTKDEILGDTHIKLFESIKNGKDKFYHLYDDFGHRLTYDTMKYLKDVIDNVMYG
jgi:predicted esterase YcpF (UPF0227 family)